MIKPFLNLINKINTDFKEHIIKTSIAVLMFATSYLLLGNIFLAFIIGSAVAILALNWDSRVFIGIALIFLISCPILLAMEKKTVAEEMAVYAYYMLALGVILQIIQYFKESFVSPKSKNLKKGRPRKKAMPIEFWGKKKVIAFVLTTTIIALIVFVSSFSFLYLKIQAEFSENEKIVSGLINSYLQDNKKIVERLAENQQKLADRVFITKQVDWESVKVLVENTTQEKDLAEEIAAKFRDIGCANVYINEGRGAPYKNTLVEYCSGCFDIAQELVGLLENSEQVAVREEPDLTDEIRVRLGTDQIIIENME